MQSDLNADLLKLADRWCERRAFLPLRPLLNGLAALNGLSDGFHECIDALKDIRNSAKGTITKDEEDEVRRLIKVMESRLPTV
jgi:hypothetical protein